MENALAETGVAEKMATRFGASEASSLLNRVPTENHFLTREF
jgi:hypothetical protein